MKDKNCIYCGKSNKGYCCPNCSTNGIAYPILCPVCVVEILYPNKNYKVDKTLKNVCEKHNLIQKVI